MKRILFRRILPALLAVMLVTACQEDPPDKSKSAEELRIEREVEKRMAAERRQSEIRAERLRTLRIVGFLALSGGALGTLIWCGWPRDAPDAPAGSGRRSFIIRHPLRGGRVIDTRPPPYPPPSDHETPRHP